MKFYRYWARESTGAERGSGERADLSIWRWSDVSPDEARAHAREALAKLVRRFQAGGQLDRYAYSERPLREESVEEVTDPDGVTRTVLSRNSYGSLVLNSSRVMFIDVDSDDQGALPSVKRLFSLFSKQPAAEPLLERVRTAAQRHPDLTLRVYRTFKGMRCLVTSETFDPTGEQTRAILEDFGSDPLYIRLCTAQDCFRARLSPKHWRIGVSKPPARYPFAGDGEERAQREWLRDYENVSHRFATCAYVETLGPGRKLFEVERTIDLHDRHACSSSDTPLA